MKNVKKLLISLESYILEVGGWGPKNLFLRTLNYFVNHLERVVGVTPYKEYILM